MRSQEVVIGGWLPGKGRREGELGALLVGYYDEGALRYAGKVGTGFGASDLRAAARAPGAAAHATRARSRGASRRRARTSSSPKLVAQVEFAEWTNTGTLRHASYEGLRDDKPATEVVREEPAGG